MMRKAEDILIRKMNFEDIRSVCEIERQCFSIPWSEKSLKGSLENPNSYFIISEVKNGIAGYAGMYFAGNQGYMYNIAVKSDFRNLGIGSRLIENIVLQCEESKLEFLSLEVRESNHKAIKLYENMNFCKIGKRKNFYTNPQEDALIMTRYF